MPNSINIKKKKIVLFSSGFYSSTNNVNKKINNKIKDCEISNQNIFDDKPNHIINRGWNHHQRKIH